MAQLRQAYLKKKAEPLQIAYPEGWQGAKSGDEFGDEIYISSMPRMLTEDEVSLVQDYLKKLPYPQELALTGCVMVDSEDPLLQMSHTELTALERTEDLPQTHSVQGKGLRSTFDRVLIIREQGHQGTGENYSAQLPKRN